MRYDLVARGGHADEAREVLRRIGEASPDPNVVR
jgi:hypothetical protein